MLESDLNRILTRSLKRHTLFAHKIADPMGGTGSQNPFDIISIYNRKPVYMESKLIKHKLSSFNFNKIEDHQHMNLQILNENLNESYTLVPVGYWASRQYYYVLFFKYETIYNWRLKGKNSVLGKEIKEYIENNKYLEIKSEKILDETNGKTKRVLYVQDLDRLDEVLI